MREFYGEMKLIEHCDNSTILLLGPQGMPLEVPRCGDSSIVEDLLIDPIAIGSNQPPAELSLRMRRGTSSL